MIALPLPTHISYYIREKRLCVRFQGKREKKKKRRKKKEKKIWSVCHCARTDSDDQEV